MNTHVNPVHGAILHRWWALPADIDHLAREQALSERDHERRMQAHPDPRDPDHPEERD